MAGRSKRGAAVAVSVAVHLAILAVVLLSTPALRLPTTRFAPDVTLYLEPLQPRLRLQSRSAAAPSASVSAAKPAPLPPTLSAVVPRPALSPIRPPPSLPTPSPPAPVLVPLPAAAAPTAATGSAQGPAAAAGDGRDWRVRPQGGDVHGLVHEAIGCGHAQYLKLTGAEQAACDRKFADLRGQDTPHIDLIPAEKRAYYDQVLKKREDQRYAAFKELHEMQLARGLAGMKTHGVDVNVGFHCTFKFGVGAKEANAAAGNRIGFPPCPIRPPGADPPPP